MGAKTKRCPCWVRTSRGDSLRTFSAKEPESISGERAGGGARGGAGGGGSCALHSPLLLGIFLTLTSLLKLTLLASEEASVWSERRESERSEDRRPGRSRQGCGRPQVHRREDRLTEAGPGWVRTKMKIEIRNFEFRIPTPCLTSVSR